MSNRIHPSAIVESGARLGEGVVVGPFCHVGPQVEIGASAELVSHVVLAGRSHIGDNVKIYPFASIGAESQDLKSRGDAGALRIGADCVIREGVTINVGTTAGGGETRIGVRCALLAYSHVGHDCAIGDGVVLSNNVLLGGHVQIGDHVAIGGASVVHQHVRIGAHAFIGGLSGLEGDLVPFALAGGNRAHLFGLNLVGLHRRGFSQERISKLRAVYSLLFGRGDENRVFAERVEAAAHAFSGEGDDVETLLAFLRMRRDRPLCMPRAADK